MLTRCGVIEGRGRTAFRHGKGLCKRIPQVIFGKLVTLQKAAYIGA